MSAFDDFMIQYQDADLIDINNVIFESVTESGGIIGNLQMILISIFARGYVVVPIEKEAVNDKTCMAQI